MQNISLIAFCSWLILEISEPTFFPGEFCNDTAHLKEEHGVESY